MRKTWFLTMVGLVLLQMNALAQEGIGKCGTEIAAQKLLKNNPSFQSVLDARRAFIEQHREKETNSNAKTTVQVTVPIVFHIVLTQNQLNLIGGATGVKQRIDSQMKVINRDFNKVNTSADFIPAVFKPVQGDAQINFVLATKKPNGASTPGYEIVITTQNSFSAQSGTMGSQILCSDVKYGTVDNNGNSTGGADAWYLNANQINYLNVWVLNFTENNILGIACPTSFSSFVPKVETGACINYRAFGKANPSTGFISGAAGGRTLSHELGHYFDLRHIWGDDPDCIQDDGINDTPIQGEENTSCPSFPHQSCPAAVNGDMYMNFMDYVNDNCYSMFTQQQCNVMNSNVTNGPSSELLDHPELTFPTSVTTIEQSNFSVYPNPAQNTISITADVNKPIRQIILTDLTGRQVRSITENNASITDYNLNVSDLPRGIYLLQCTFANGTATKKIVLQ